MLRQVSGSSIRLLIFVATGVICASALAIGLTIWWLHTGAIRDAYADITKLAIVLAEQTENSVQSIDIILTETKNQEEALSVHAPGDYEHILGSEDTYRLLRERQSRLGQAEFIALVDINGRLLNTTQEWPSPEFDLSGRDYFRHFKNNDDNGVYVSHPELSHINGLQVIFFSKGIRSADNKFLGVVVIGVRVSYFQQIYETIASFGDNVFLLSLNDGTIVARFPKPIDRIDAKIPADSPWYRVIPQGGGHYRSPGLFDGVRHLATARPLRGYPLVVNAAIPEAAALATWRIQAIMLGLGATLGIFGSAFLLRSLSRQFHRLETSEAALFEKAADLERANERFEAALSNMAQGLLMFDADGKLSVSNRRFAEMLELPWEKWSAASMGMTVPETMQLRYKLHERHVTTRNDAEIIATVRDALGQHRPGSVVAEFSDGRAMRASIAPMSSGGFVATFDDITERRCKDNQIAHMARYDSLTDLPNRATFNETLNAAIDRAATSGECFAVLCIDLDHFKEANDTFGHLVGDSLLCEIASRLRESAQGAFVARLGGDEFALIMADDAQPAAAAALAERLLATAVNNLEIEGHRLQCGVSIGAAIYPKDGIDAKTLMTNADAALYRAKADFRGKALFFEPEMGARLLERYSLQEDLRSALEHGELSLHYQPQVRMSGKTVGFEALIRWQCPKRGMVPPSTFIAVAEESSLILPVGEWVLREACREAASWPQPLVIAVNVSPIQFRHGDLPALVHSILLETGLPPGRLELEITENVLVNDFSRAISIINRLKSLGVRIAVDDFGSGYSSLSYLQSFSCDKIKIDRIFICDLETNHRSKSIVRAVVGLGRSLGLPILAEGVETESQHAFLLQEGCDEVQGYLTGRPLPIAHYDKTVGRQTTPPRRYAVVS
jgi:diguanylate cyclase (GGDEF)-like protein